jgi:terminal uridylyltransferase
MDLCCLIESDPNLSAADLVSMLGDLLERGGSPPVICCVDRRLTDDAPLPSETKFTVKPLPYARIPIVKLSLDPSPGLPQGIACDIGFENKLALENTRLLMCYAMIDPARVRTMVLFREWSGSRPSRTGC